MKQEQLFWKACFLSLVSDARNNGNTKSWERVENNIQIQYRKKSISKTGWIRFLKSRCKRKNTKSPLSLTLNLGSLCFRLILFSFYLPLHSVTINTVMMNNSLLLFKKFLTSTFWLLVLWRFDLEDEASSWFS